MKFCIASTFLFSRHLIVNAEKEFFHFLDILSSMTTESEEDLNNVNK